MMTVNFFRLEIGYGIPLSNISHGWNNSCGKAKGFRKTGLSHSWIGGQDHISNGAGNAVFHRILLLDLV